MQIIVIGGGPAGLRAAEVAAGRGASVTLFEAKPAPGRKFLVAGCDGLNLTRVEPRERFATRYSGPGMTPDTWPSLLSDFDSDAMRAWAAELGVETFASSAGRVYPQGLKSARLLRRWMQRLRQCGVHFQTNHRWTGLTPGKNHPWQADFVTGNGSPITVEADAVILALGGGSWPRTGSNGSWTGILGGLGIDIAPLEAANCGWELAWPASVLAKVEGRPLKNLVVRAGNHEAAGELIITRYGLEGGALYALGPSLRTMWREHGVAELRLDLKPDFTAEALIAKLGTLGKTPRPLLGEAHARWRLSDTACALLESRGPFFDPVALATEVKDFRLPLTGPRPLAEAISSAGGVRWHELTHSLMLRRLPGVFVAGEMIDWEAPTGGYLLQGCFATGTRAGNQALEWLRSRKPGFS